VYRLKDEIVLLKNKNDTLLLKNEKLWKLVISLKEYCNKEKERFISRFSKTLKDIFSPTQIEMLLNPKKRVFKWTSDDISSAISIRSISPKAYRFLQEEKKFPLPGL